MPRPDSDLDSDKQSLVRAIAEAVRDGSKPQRLTREEILQRREEGRARRRQARTDKFRRLVHQAGVPDPEPGTKLAVRCVATLKGRRRCQIDFDPKQPTNLEVTSLSTEDARRERAAGNEVVSRHEAREIVLDDALIVASFAPRHEELEERARSLTDREERLAKREAELAAAAKLAKDAKVETRKGAEDETKHEELLDKADAAGDPASVKHAEARGMPKHEDKPVATSLPGPGEKPHKK